MCCNSSCVVTPHVMRVHPLSQTLISVLRYGDPRAQECVASVIQNLSCANGGEMSLCSAGAVPPLVEILRGGGSEEAQACAVQTLRNLATNIACHHSIILTGGIGALATLCLRNPLLSPRPLEVCSSSSHWVRRIQSYIFN